jgi:hypothetical protein
MIITGEQFQELADICLATEINSTMASQKIRGNLKLFDDIPVSEIKKYKKIFVYTHDLNIFFQRYFDHLNDDTILITHNSDFPITQESKKYLDSNKIKKWYCQNRDFYHEKLVTIPIGLANSQWPHGNQELIKSVKEQNIEKEILVYKNFDSNTCLNYRLPCHEITKMNGIPMYPSKTNREYWEMLARSMFVISPRGNGVDCHRIWECLYLNSIPVILDHENFSEFKHLPILFTPKNDWGEITIDFLRSQVSNFVNKFDNPILELTIEYWKERINKGE